MKKGVIFICAALTMMLNSCGLYSKYDKQTSVDSSLYGEAVEKIEAARPGEYVDSLTLGNITWREIFSDKKLQALIEQGLESNTDLKVAKMRIEDASTSLSASRLAYLPSLSLSPQGTISGLLDGGTSYETYTVPLTAAWEVDIFGRITNEKLKTKMLLEQQIYTTQATQAEIVAAIANLYYTISMLEQQTAIAIATEKSWEESYRVAQSMKEAGMMTQAGLSQIEASLYSVKMAVVNLTESLKKSQNAMCSILAITPRVIEGGELFDVTLPESLRLGVPMQMLSSRPDVMATEAALAASFYSRNVARSSFYPSISLSGTLGWTNSANGVILDPAEFVYSFVGQLVQPIFNRGLNRAQLKIAKSQLEMSRMAFEQQLIDAGIEVNDALTSLLTSQANATLYANQVVALRSAAQSTMLLMRHSSTTYLDVLTAQQSLFNAELGMVSNRYDQMQSLITLYKALGGGRF